jgi:drug/metabolite transporter (DMT)-like permease
MWVFPMAAAVVSALFCALVAQQWVRKGRPHQGAWAAALLMFAVASFAAAIGMLGEWSPALFRLYYLFGAIINVPFLGAGTIYLLARRPLGHAFALIVVVGAIFAAGVVFGARLDPEPLARATGEIPSGRDVWIEVLPRTLSRYYSFAGLFIVVAGALWSSWRLAQQRSERLRGLAIGNILIAVGTLVVGVASQFARYGRGSVFAVGLLVGVSVMFAGFLRTRPPIPREEQPR